MYSYERQIIRKKKSSLTRSLYFMAIIIMINYGYKNFPVYNYILTGWSKTFKDSTCLAGFVVYCRPCINVHVKAYLLSPGERHLLISSNIKVILTTPPLKLVTYWWVQYAALLCGFCVTKRLNCRSQ